MASESNNIGINLLLRVQDFIAGFTDAKSAGKAAASDIGESFKKIPDIKPKVDDTAINTVKSRIEELKSKLTLLNEQKFSLGNIADINASKNAIRSVQNELGSLGNTLHELDPKSKQAFKSMEQGAQQAEGPLSGLKGIIGGLFAGGGILAGGEVLKGLFEAGKEGAKDEDKLTLAFKGNATAAKEASDNADKLALKYNIMPGVLKEVSANAALMGGFTGEANKNITELAAGMEGLKLPGISATMVVRAFTMGAGDPEGQEGLGRLNRQFPLLATGLAGITDPAEKAKKALEIMGPQFKMLQLQAGDSANASERMGVAMKIFEESVGKVFYGVIAGTVLPVITQLVTFLTGVSVVFDGIHGPILTVIKILGGLVVGIAAVLGVTTLLNTAIVKNIAANIEAGISDLKGIALKIWKTAVTVGETIATAAGAIATWAAAAATWALSAAMVVLTSPITLIVLGLLALGAAVVWAYNNFAPFKNAVDAIWDSLKTAAEFVWKFKEYLLLLLGPIGIVVGGLMLLYEKVEFVHKAFDAIGGFFTKLFGGGPKEGAEAVAAVKDTFDKEIAARQEADAKITAQRQAALSTKLADIKANENAGTITAQQANDQRAAAQKEFDDAEKKSNEEQSAFIKSKNEAATVAMKAEYDKQKAALVETYKKGGESAEDFNSKMSTLDASLKSQLEKVQATGDAWQDAKKKYDDYAAGLQKKYEDAAKDNKQEIDNANTMVTDALGKLGFVGDKAAQMFLAAQKKGFPGLNKEAVAEALQNIEYAKQKLKTLHEDEGTAHGAGLLTGTAEDDKSKKSGRKTPAEILKSKYDEEKSAADAMFALKSANREKEMIAAGASANEIRDALAAIERDKSAKLLSIADDYQKQSLSLTGKGADEMKSEMTLTAAQAALTVSKNDEAARKTLDDERKAADTKELSAYDAKKKAIADTEKKSQEAAKVLRARFGKDDVAAEKEYQDTLLAITAKANKDYLAAEKDFYDKKLKAQQDALKLEVDKAKKHVEDMASAQQSKDEGLPAGQDKDLALQADKTAKKLALLQIEHENAVAMAKLAGDDTTAIDAKFEQDKTVIAQTANNERMKIVEDYLKKENIAYQSAMKGLSTLFDGFTKMAIASLDKLLGFEKGMTANEIALENDKKFKSEQSLTDEVRTNKITYQDYVHQKQALEDDYNKKMKGNSQSLTDVLKAAEKSVVDSVVQSIAKKFEAWVVDQVTKLALSLVYRATDTAATTAQATATAALWAPAAALASIASFGAADVAASAGIVATGAVAHGVALTGAAEGMVYDPSKKGPNGQLIAIGETGKKEFASPETTAKDYFVNDFGPQLMSLMGPKAQQVYGNLQSNGNIVPHISPAFTGTSSNKDMADLLKKATDTMLKVHTVMDNIHKNGIDVTGKLEAKINPKESEKATRLRNQRINARASVTGGGMTSR